MMQLEENDIDPKDTILSLSENLQSQKHDEIIHNDRVKYAEKYFINQDNPSIFEDTRKKPDMIKSLAEQLVSKQQNKVAREKAKRKR